MKIITDTSSLFTEADGEKLGITVLPLSVALGNETYREFTDIDGKTFNDKVLSGMTPTSSQPSIGITMEAFEKYQNDDVLVINIADGLSGTYKSTVSACMDAPNLDRIHVINSKTLCGPHRYLVQKAMELEKEGVSITDIVSNLVSLIETTNSFLIPQDFEFLKRGGRLTPLAAKMGGLLKIVPVMMTSSDGTRLEKFAVKKTYKGAVKDIALEMLKLGVDDSYNIYVAHAYDEERATTAVTAINEVFPNNTVEVLELSPAFITQGGPGCIAIQYIKK